MYDAALGRFIQPDTVVPSIANPQNFNPYSYVLNRPINYNDPSGHCADPITAPICLSLVPAGPPGWIIDGVILVFSLAMIGYAADRLLAEDVGKALTKDEQEKVDRLGNAEQEAEAFLQKHPNLRDEQRRKEAGEKLPYDHPGEADDVVRGLEKAIENLRLVRRSRNPEAQAEIDRAISRGERAIDKITEEQYGKR